jgi:serine/threonine protein phosphatase PrpC
LSSSTATTQAPPRQHPHPCRLDCFGLTNIGLVRAKNHPQPAEAPAARRSLVRVEAFGLSDRGLHRETNEDAYAVVPRAGLFIVADGMGGHAGGEVASRMTVCAVRSALEAPDGTRSIGLPAPSSANGLLQLRASIELANAEVHAAAVADATNMGTTLTALLVLGDRVALGHVGDSRAYRLRGRTLERLTDDHTYVNMLVNAGAITREQARTSELRHMLARAIGTDPAVEIDTRLLHVDPGDTFLLATDGLHGVLDDGMIAAILLGESDLTRAAAELVGRANDAGGPDNVTVVLVRIG